VKTYQLNELTSRECHEYLKNGGDLVFLPIGSIDRIGPHLPLGSNIFIANALSETLAKKCQGYCLPALPFSNVPDSFEGKGTVDISMETMYDLIYDICKELVENGFRRIIIVGNLRSSMAYYVVNEFFEQENIAIAAASSESIMIKEANDKNERETALIAACLKLCNREDLLNQLYVKNEKYYGRFNPSYADSKPVDEIRKLGTIGYYYKKDEYPILPVKRILIDEALKAIESWVDDTASAIEELKDYNYYLSRRRFDRGFR